MFQLNAAPIATPTANHAASPVAAKIAAPIAVPTPIMVPELLKFLLFTWDNFTRQPSDIYDKDLKIADDNPRKNRLRYDLHGFTLEDANKKVKDLILSGIRNKYKEILLITGKGLHSNTEEDTYVSKNLSKLRFSVPEFINSCDELSKFVVFVKSF